MKQVALCYKQLCGTCLLIVARCKGSELANRTCDRCGRVYATYDSCRMHERSVEFNSGFILNQPEKGQVQIYM